MKFRLILCFFLFSEIQIQSFSRLIFPLQRAHIYREKLMAYVCIPNELFTLDSIHLLPLLQSADDDSGRRRGGECRGKTTVGANWMTFISRMPKREANVIAECENTWKMRKRKMLHLPLARLPKSWNSASAWNVYVCRKLNCENIFASSKFQ